MFIINPNRLLNLKEYGILIPLLDKRFIECTKWIHQHVDSSLIHTMINPSPLSFDELTTCHEKIYIDLLTAQPEKEIIQTFELLDANNEYHRYDPQVATRPLHELVERISSHIRGSLIASEICLANSSKFSFFLGGGLHHAMSFGGRGFCLLNDIVLSIKLLQQKKLIETAWVIDVDAHKGDGTAQITQDDESIITLSIHMGNGWPLNSEKYDESGQLRPWFIPSNIDIEIFPGDENQYNDLLLAGLQKLTNTYPKPDMVIINLGSDPYEGDELESTNLMNLNLDQMQKRDRLLFDFFFNWKIPQTYLMSGGYGENAHLPYLKFFEYLQQKKII